MIPEIIRANKAEPKIHIATSSEFEEKLLEKLQEEVLEFQEAKSVEELADILEVIDAIKILYEWSDSSVQKVKSQKAAARGTFSKKLILEEVINNG